MAEKTLKEEKYKGVGLQKDTKMLAYGQIAGDHPRNLWSLARVGKTPYLFVARDDDVAEFDLGCDVVVDDVGNHEHADADSDCPYCSQVALSTATFCAVSVKVSERIVKAIVNKEITTAEIGILIGDVMDTLIENEEETDCPIYCADFQSQFKRAEWMTYCHRDSGLQGTCEENVKLIADEFKQRFLIEEPKPKGEVVYVKAEETKKNRKKKPTKK